MGFGRQAGRDETGGQNTHVWLLTEPATKLKSQATPYRFLTTWPDNGLGKDGAGRGPWERELDALPTLWWADLREALKDLARSLFDPYRPELHYMRGPGPKWHAKHDRAPLDSYDALTALVPLRSDAT